MVEFALPSPSMGEGPGMGVTPTATQAGAENTSADRRRTPRFNGTPPVAGPGRLRRHPHPNPSPIKGEGLLAATLAVLLTTPALAQAPARLTASPTPAVFAQDYRTPDPENVLVIETTKGRILVEMAPDAAPAHVERIKLLTREKLYDGLVFHRVIDKFMAQTGDPLGTGEGQSSHPDVKGEFTWRRDATAPFTPAAQLAGQTLGFSRTLPVATQPDDLMVFTADKKVAAWGLYCPGVAGMARGEPTDSANSQFFLMRQPYPSLEKRYTAWGRVIDGLPVVRAIKVGEPVVDPDRMTRVRVLADIPAAERPTVRVMDTAGPAFRARLAAARAAKGADFSPCDLDIPTQITEARR